MDWCIFEKGPLNDTVRLVSLKRRGDGETEDVIKLPNTKPSVGEPVSIEFVPPEVEGAEITSSKLYRNQEAIYQWDRLSGKKFILNEAFEFDASRIYPLLSLSLMMIMIMIQFVDRLTSAVRVESRSSQ